MPARDQPRLRIGIDLDNTLINYDHVFVSVAKIKGLIGADFHGTKQEIRQTIGQREDGETQWMALQGRVYGAYMHEATLFDGVGDFLRRCRVEHCTVYIASHKTEFGHYDPDRINLRDAATRWMETQGFFDEGGFGLRRENVFFAATRAEKCQQITTLAVTHFIDDLEEVLLDPSFPGSVKQHLFQPGALPTNAKPFSVHGSWAEIENAIFSRS